MDSLNNSLKKLQDLAKATYGDEDTWAIAAKVARDQGQPVRGNQKKGNKSPSTAWNRTAKAIWRRQMEQGKTPAYLAATGKFPGSRYVGRGGKELGRPKGSGKKETVEKAITKEYTGAQQRASERKTLNSMRRKSTDMNSYDELKGFWKDNSDTYVKRKPVALDVMKDHQPTPPREGLVWDAVKHRWARPEHVGETVVETQGKKRIRGSGTGAHQRGVSGTHPRGGPGKVYTAGRRFKSVHDKGVATVHHRTPPSGKIRG
jgi:hypothetical protein